MLITAYILLGTAVVLTGFIKFDARQARRRAETDDLDAVEARLRAAGELPAPAAHDCNDHEPYARGGTVYTSSATNAVEVVDTAVPVDVWMVKAVTVDPTLTAADVATAVEHVAPGVGSVASVAAVAEDTRMRTSAQLRELQAAELEAYAEAPAQEDRLFFAAYDRQMARALTRFDEATARVDQWEAYQHRDNEHECAHCRRAVKENSDEYKLIRSLDDTGSISRADIDALYAAHGATT